MKADAITLLGIFESKMRLEIPLFQRQYVWSEERQWEPLWEDIARKFIALMEGKTDSPVHFLGAMVFDQKQTPITHVGKRQVIDGQQRLTTFQIFLAAFRDFCTTSECADVADELQQYIFNKGMMPNPETDRFKVWPTQADRSQFQDVMTSGSRLELLKRYPLIKKKYARAYDPRPQMVEAYLYFYKQLAELFTGTTSDPAFAADRPLGERVEVSFGALKELLKVVVIDLDNDDDAQVIFETLNARGEPLLPADLLRNFIFLRAARSDKEPPIEDLYEKHWKKFDDDFWRKEVKQGRLTRPRSDLYIQHFLASKQTDDIPIKHLFAEYKNWIERKTPYESVEAELATLSRQGDAFRRIIEPQQDDVIFPLVTFLDAFDIRTAYPLLLHLLEQELSDEEWRNISLSMESYLLRRAMCGLTTKNYNRTFLSLVKTLQKDGTSAERIAQALAGFKGESNEWPRDEQFRIAWHEGGVYRLLQHSRLLHLLKSLDATYFSAKCEAIVIDSPLTIEHLMPQNWIEHWPLPDGSKGLTYEQMEDRDPADPVVIATKRRDSLIHSIGNLTILSEALNPAISNLGWASKKPEIMKYSLLPINQLLHDQTEWTEGTIEQRSIALFKKAITLWPPPNQTNQ